MQQTVILVIVLFIAYHMFWMHAIIKHITYM